MTAITNGDDFIQAVNEWKKIHSFQGTPYINTGDRKIFDEIPDPTPEAPGHVRYIDVTPLAAVVEAALDTAIAQQTQEQSRASVRDTAADGLRGNRLGAITQQMDDDDAARDTDFAALNAATLAQTKAIIGQEMTRAKRQALLMKRIVQILSHE